MTRGSFCKKRQSVALWLQNSLSVDKETGVNHTNITNSTHVHDVTVMERILFGTGEKVYGDFGCLEAEKREKAITDSEKDKKTSKNQ